MNVLITGGTGFVGTALSQLLIERGHKVTILTRQKGKKKTADNLSYALWDPSTGMVEETVWKDADAVINLAGANVGTGRWTKKQKEIIRSSRTDSCHLICKALKSIPNNIKTILSASGTGWYGADVPGKIPFREEAPADKAYLGEVCVAWENAIKPVTEMGNRLVIFRTGLVLGKEGGALEAFEKPIRAGLAAIMGTGAQVVSWIDIHDICRMYLYALENGEVEGIYNAVAPYPVTNKNLILELATKLKKGAFIPLHVPVFLLKWILGEMSVEILKSVTVSSDKISQAGFTFRYPSIEASFDTLLER